MRVAETRAVKEPCGRPTASASARSRKSALGTIRVRLQEVPSTKRKWEREWERTGPKVRDRLCQIIRQHQLDPELVKAYAVDFCGTKTLRDATREQVENFVQSPGRLAEKDRNALVCQLNSYLGQKEGAA